MPAGYARHCDDMRRRWPSGVAGHQARAAASFGIRKPVARVHARYMRTPHGAGQTPNSRRLPISHCPFCTPNIQEALCYRPPTKGFALHVDNSAPLFHHQYITATTHSVLEIGLDCLERALDPLCNGSLLGLVQATSEGLKELIWVRS